jgi:glycosyltransferase involved in cell wall biosynthesis
VRHQQGVQISAVVCTYRNPVLLEGAIRSLLTQDMPAVLFEIIVVDNNSRDRTPDVVRRLGTGAQPEVQYFIETRQGLSHARNCGVAHASADIVAFMDDDAEADPHWLSALLMAYDDSTRVWAAGGKVLPIWEGERPSWLHDSMLRSLSILDWGDETRPLHWPERMIGTNCSFRKRVFSDTGQFDTNLGRKGRILLGSEDTEMQERIHSLGGLVIYTPHAIVHHHVPRDRMTKSYFCRRAYGHGRSMAVLTAKREGRSVLARRSLRISAAALAKQCLGLVLNYRREDRQLNALQGLAHAYGYLQQAVRLLLLGREQ